MTQLIPAQFEQKFFRALNTLVEPAVRKGFASPTLLPGGLIVLESVGFKSGQQRRTPLLSFRIGRYLIISTVRGNRSFWVRNLMQQPKVSYFLGGRRRDAEAIILLDGKTLSGEVLPSRFLDRLMALLSRYAKDGMALAILVPAKA
ncbi:MAG: deazaflavin-dependent oxidoreductase (nitroreductase family) [Halioglobus sp.]|jgi:deazaflavin-dependent oxidoreductase (nitroreductase family)